MYTTSVLSVVSLSQPGGEKQLPDLSWVPDDYVKAAAIYVLALVGTIALVATILRELRKRRT